MFMPLDSRRRFLVRALASGIALTHASRIFAAEFWNAKDPSTWTGEEIGILTQKSPWAKTAAANYRGAEDPTGNAPEGGRAGRGAAAPTITVCWESAQPILDALRAPLAGGVARHYGLGVTNFPV